MKKEYVSPRVDIIYTNVEDALLKGTNGGGDIEGPGAKAMILIRVIFLMNLFGMMKIDGNNL